MHRIGGSGRLRNIHQALTSLMGPLALMACNSPEPATPDLAAVGQARPAYVEPQQPRAEDLKTRLIALDRAVERWQAASSLRTAHEAAEEARNLIVGSSGPYYGDANKDGITAGANTVGILPGARGGISLARSGDNACVVADVLGGSWREPARRWSTLHDAISSWTATRNTFPSLPSHPQRVVGWASLALRSTSLAEARGYASHARLHVDVSVRAVESCRLVRP